MLLNVLCPGHLVDPFDWRLNGAGCWMILNDVKESVIAIKINILRQSSVWTRTAKITPASTQSFWEEEGNTTTLKRLSEITAANVL